jgi:microcystin degradation protein MlrC
MGGVVRFFVGMFSHQTNTFSTFPTDRRPFEARDLRYGSEILEAYRSTGTCLDGMIAAASEHLPERAPSHLPARRPVSD